MSKILFCIPYETMVSYAKEVLSDQYPNIEVSLSRPRETVQLVRTHINQGVKIVAARAVSVADIKNAQLDVIVVTIPITSFDIIRAIKEAKLQGKRIAVITKSPMGVVGIDFLAKDLGVEFLHYDIDNDPDYEKITLEAVADGAEVVLGGAMTVTAATRLGIPCSLIKIGSESLLQAAQEAVRLQNALETETAKREFFSTILERSRDGVITTDKYYRITEINPVAQKLTSLNKTVLGQPIEIVLPQLKIGKNSDKKNPHSLISVRGTKVMYNSVPIVVNNNLFGFVITLQEISKIQQMEAIIRKEIYASGHYAKYTFKDIIGTEPKIKKVIETANDYAATNSNILILGESGTGKEMFAQSIHNASNRSKEPFVAINCAALPAQILESEMFGYVGGAFTGASKEGKPGLFEVAHGGTVFLDEITEMDYVNQGRLLRVLQEKTVVRLGSYKVTPVDIRIIAATNKDLETLVQQNVFRLDLFYRLNVLRLNIPPLKERKADIALYAQLFLREFATNSGKTFKLSDDAVEHLQEYYWPGNIRELRNFMERMAVITKNELITGAMLRETLNSKTAPEKMQSAKEKRMVREIKKALKETGGNYTRAAESLGVDRSTLWRRMQRLKIEY